MSDHEIPWVETGHADVTHIAFMSEGDQLWLAYGSGNVYRFTGVPKRWYDDLKRASRPSKFVKDKLIGRFTMRKLHGYQPT